MARYTFGGTAADFVVTVGPAGALHAVPARLTFWTARTGGTQITDLLVDAAPESSVRVQVGGQVPAFQGPDEVAELWADAGRGDRSLMLAQGRQGARGPAGPSGGPFPDLDGVAAGLVPITTGDEGVDFTDFPTETAEMLGRATILATQNRRVRQDGARSMPSMAQFYLDPAYFIAELDLGDSTGASPNTIDDGPLGGANGYLRQFDAKALLIAARHPEIRVELDVLDWHNYGEDRTSQGGIDQTAWVIGPNFPAFQTRRVLSVGSGECYAELPGSTGQFLRFPLDETTKLRGAEVIFVAIDMEIPDWTPSTTKNLICLGNGTDDTAFRFTLNTSGQLVAVTSVNGGVSTLNNPQTILPSPAGSGRLCVGVLMEPNVGGTDQRYTFFTAPGGDMRNWVQLGSPVTRSGVFTWHNPAEPWWGLGALSTGGSSGASLEGKIYEVQVHRGGVHGPSILPEHPAAWAWSLPGVAPIKGGPVLRIVNASRPGWGLKEFDEGNTDTGNVSPLPLMIPLLPYGGAIINTGHNDGDLFGPGYFDKLDRVLARIERRIGGADIAFTTQNPTLRVDGPASNPTSRRLGGAHRMAELSGWARSRGVGVIDSYSAFTDYVDGCAAGTREPVAFKPDGVTPGDGTLGDLLDVADDPLLGGQQGVHPKANGVTLQAQKLYDEESA